MTESSQRGAGSGSIGTLDRDVRVRIAVAETQGWREVRITDDDDPYFDAGDLVGLPPDWKERDISFSVGFRDDDDIPDSRDLAPLPNYLTDPAAWGALEDAERVEVSYVTGQGGFVCARCAGLAVWFERSSRGEAVCAAVLAKYNLEV